MLKFLKTPAPVEKKVTVKQQGGVLVKRDEEGKITAVATAPKPTVKGTQSPEAKRTFRNALYKMTDGGLDNIKTLISLRDGEPQVHEMPDGRKSEPIYPTPEVRRASAMNLHEILHGKPVAASEVLKAEKEAEDMERYRAMSNDELRAAALPWLERVERGEEVDAEIVEEKESEE